MKIAWMLKIQKLLKILNHNILIEENVYAYKLLYYILLKIPLLNK